MIVNTTSSNEWSRMRFNALFLFRLVAAICVGLPCVQHCYAEELFKITVLDAQTRTPVPLVELTTTHHVKFVSDNAGVIAFDLPELMEMETWFSVEGHGYEVDVDGLGFRGVRLTPTAAGEATIQMKRKMPAHRIGRLTGAGLFAESQRFNEHADWTESGVLGCDSVQLARWGDKLFWFWGDTTIAEYPLGLFHMSGAATPLRPFESLQPPLKPRFELFRDAHGKPREVARLPGDGPTWLSGLMVVPDTDGSFRLLAGYEKIRPPLTA